MHRVERALFLRNAKQQGVLVGSGVIIPVRHAATLFDLTSAELRDTFMLLVTVKAWMDETYHPDNFRNCRPERRHRVNDARVHLLLTA